MVSSFFLLFYKLGHLRYFNLEIKKSCLDSLSVPIGIVRGVVKSLSVNLTTASIFSNDPLKLIVDIFHFTYFKVEDLCLIVEPIDNYPIEDSIRNYYVSLLLSCNVQNAKLSEIKVAEVKRQLQKALLTKEEGGKDEGGFLSGLLRNIINNLEITLLRVSLFIIFQFRFT